MTINTTSKIDALRTVNHFIIQKIDKLVDEKDKSDSELLTGNNIFINDNGETTYQIIKLPSGYVSENIHNSEFKRIICLKGSFNIFFPDHKDTTVVHSPNTILVPPKTTHIIKTVEDSEVIIVYKPNFNITGYKIIEENTIYKKESK